MERGCARGVNRSRVHVAAAGLRHRRAPLKESFISAFLISHFSFLIEP
jgi:hypothetical protein